MSTHNICFCREIRKILCGYPLLSVAMIFLKNRHFLSKKGLMNLIYGINTVIKCGI